MDTDTLRVSLFSKLRAQISQHLLRSEGVSTNWARLSGTLLPQKLPTSRKAREPAPRLSMGDGHFQAVLVCPSGERDGHVLGGKTLPVTMAFFFLKAVGSTEALSGLPRTA